MNVSALSMRKRKRGGRRRRRKPGFKSSSPVSGRAASGLEMLLEVGVNYQRLGELRGGLSRSCPPRTGSGGWRRLGKHADDEFTAQGRRPILAAVDNAAEGETGALEHRCSGGHSGSGCRGGRCGGREWRRAGRESGRERQGEHGYRHLLVIAYDDPGRDYCGGSRGGPLAFASVVGVVWSSTRGRFSGPAHIRMRLK